MGKWGQAIAASTVLAHLWSPAAFAQDTTSLLLTYQGADREQRLIEGATREKEIVYYSAMIVNQALRPLTAAFQKKYPFIRMSYWRGDSEDIFAKLTAEMRAGRPVADIVEGTGVGELVVKGNIAQPVWSENLAAIPEARRDPNGLWVPTRMSYFSAAYNTRQVAAADVPKTYEDLLDPRWKGKMAWPLASASAAPPFVTNLRIAWGEDKAMAYFQKLRH